MPFSRPPPNAPPRRSLRSSSVAAGAACTAPAPHEKCIKVSSSEAPTTAATPRKKKQPVTRKVRFSDPGPALADGEDELSTGLTPMIRRASLASHTRKRHQSTPSRLSRADDASPIHEVHFLPLRQVLDGRVKRRIRRSGLSEEMNAITKDKRKKAQDVEAELDRLRAELAAKDDEIHRLQDETIEIDSDRIWDLEQQVKKLKEQLVGRSFEQRQHQQQLLTSSPARNWSAPQDPFVDDFMDLDVSGAFSESTVLVCSTPSRRLRASFPTPPTTSPARELEPVTPCIRDFQMHPTPFSHVAVQADLPDPEKQALREELDSLHLEAAKLTATLESYTTLTTRLSDKLSPFAPDTNDLEHRLTHVLTLLSERTTALSDRTVALTTLSHSLSDLGFPGTTPTSILHSLTTSLRAARLELEYLSPGECALPLSSSGAAVLDLVLARLRALAKANKEADDQIDEYHAIELSLRQQLAARVSAMGTLHSEVTRLEAEGRDKDGRVADLEIGLERCKGALGRYARDVGEMEALVARLEGELETAVAARAKDKAGHDYLVRGQTAELAARVKTIEELEGRLGEAVQRTAELQNRLAEVQVVHARELEEIHVKAKAEKDKVGRAQGAALALRDARVAELRGEVERVNGALREAYETVKELKVENGKLRAQNEELARGSAVKRRRGSSSGEAEGSERRGSLLGGDLAIKGKRRRKHDSGLGLLDEEAAAL